MLLSDKTQKKNPGELPPMVPDLPPPPRTEKQTNGSKK